MLAASSNTRVDAMRLLSYLTLLYEYLPTYLTLLYDYLPTYLTLLYEYLPTYLPYLCLALA